MAERDPFGRLIDEDPLAGLGALSDGSEPQTAEPVVPADSVSWGTGEDDAPSVGAGQSAQADSRPPPSMPRSTGNPELDRTIADAMQRVERYAGSDPAKVAKTVTRGARLIVFAIVAVILVSVGSSIFTASNSVTDRFSELPSPKKVIEEAREKTRAATDGAAGAGEEALPRGLGSNSMLRQRNLGPALRNLSRSGLGRMRTLSIRPERLDAQLLTRGGRLRSVQRRYDGTQRTFGTSGPGFNHLDTIAFAKIDPAAPARLARSAAGRLKRPVSQVDYVVLLNVLGKTSWSVFMRDGRNFRADSHGRITRRVS